MTHYTSIEDARYLATAREQLGLARAASPTENFGPPARVEVLAHAQTNIERHFRIWYERSALFYFPQAWWEVASRVLARQIAFYADMERITPPVLDQMALLLLKELGTLQRVYPSDHPPLLLQRLDILPASELLARVWEFSIPREGGENEYPSVTQLVEDVRSARRKGRGNPTWEQKFWQEKVLERWRQLPLGEGVPASWWEYVTKRFAAQMAISVDFARVTTDLVGAVGQNLYRELDLLRRAYPKGENPHTVLALIDILSAEQILGMVRDYGRAVTVKVSEFSDPIAAAEHFKTNRPFVERALVDAGYKNIATDLIWHTNVCFEESRDVAVRRALLIAEEWRAQGRGRSGGKGSEPPPPTAAAGGEGEVEPTRGGGGGTTSSSPRSILEISRGLKGFTTLTAPFVFLDVAEHKTWISPGQKTLIVGGLMGAMTYLDRMTPGHLALLYAPFEMGRLASQQGLEMFGVRKESLWHKVGGTVGAFAGAEGFVTFVGKGAGASTLRESHLLGRQVLHDSLLNIGRNVQESLGAVRETIAGGWRMIAGSLPTAAEARIIGAALATGIVNFGGRLVTPLILPTDALSVFLQRRGPSI